MGKPKRRSKPPNKPQPQQPKAQEPAAFPSPTPSYRLKLARANKHIADLEALLARWSKGGYRLTEETDEEGIETVYAQLLRPVPEEASLLIGDAAQGLFCALDHLAFALARANDVGLAEAQEEVTKFPIQSRCPRNNKGVITPDRRTAALHPCARAAIGLIQPYLGEEGFEKHPLWLLRDLADRDKHRMVTAVAFGDADQPASATVGPGGGYLDYLRIFGGQKLGAERVPLFAHSMKNHGNIQIRMTVDVAFDKGPAVQDRFVVSTMRLLRDHVSRVIDLLERFI